MSKFQSRIPTMVQEIIIKFIGSKEMLEMLMAGGLNTLGAKGKK